MDIPKKKSIDVDCDKLLVLVEARKPIYNYNLKDHHNQDVINKLWEEIGKEPNVPVCDCRSKWHSLRASYTHYRRDLKKLPSGSAASKKKWYLADAMSFLEVYTGSQRLMTSNLPITQGYVQPIETREDIQAIENEVDNPNPISQIEDNRDIIAEPIDQRISAPSGDKKRKRLSAAEIVAAPMVDYLKSATVKSREEEDPNLIFFKSLLPDVKKLDAKRQRKFKTKVMELLNNFLDNQEESELVDRSRSASSNSCFNYSSDPPPPSNFSTYSDPVNVVRTTQESREDFSFGDVTFPSSFV